jgi:hypothetical protein
MFNWQVKKIWPDIFRRVFSIMNYAFNNKKNIYLIIIDRNNSSNESKQFSDSDYAINICTIVNNGYRWLILKIVQTNILQLFSDI